MDCSLPDSSIHGIFQARVLEWVPLPSPRKRLPAPKIGALKIIGEAKGSKLGWVFRNVFRRLHQCPSLGEGNGTHSSTLAWKIPWMEEPGRLQSMGVAKSWTRLSNSTFTFHFHALEKEMATHSSVLAWRIPGTGEPGGLPSCFPLSWPREIFAYSEDS